MKMPLSLFGVACAMLSFLASSAVAADVGKKAPDFSLQDIHGKTVSLSDFAGKVVVLEWTNYGCPFVRKHYNSGNMQRLQTMAKEKDVVWLSVCSSAPGQQGSMEPSEWLDAVKEKGVKSADVLLDEDGTVGRTYGAIATPNMYVIDQSGTLVYEGAIDSIPSTKVADIEKAKNYVVAALDAVLHGQPVEETKTKPYGCSVKYAR